MDRANPLQREELEEEGEEEEEKEGEGEGEERPWVLQRSGSVRVAARRTN
jgi:hypothetical protein